MLFKGRLRLPDDAGEGIPIDLTIEDVYLALDSEGEDLGEWRLDVIEITRLFSNQFSLLLDGEEMVFIADDALGFAYEGIAFVEDVQGRLSRRRPFRRGRKSRPSRSEPATVAAEHDPEPSQTPGAVESPAPDPVPPLPEPAARSGSFAEAVAQSRTDDPDIAPVDPVRIDPADLPPAHLAPATPPPGDEPLVASADRPPQPHDANEEPADVAPAAASAPAPPASPQPVSADETPEPSDDDEDDELIIEDVNAYGYAAPVTLTPGAERRTVDPTARPAPPEPEPEPEPEPKPEHRPVEAPAAGSDDARSIDDPPGADGDVEVDPVEVEPEGVAPVSEPELGESGARPEPVATPAPASIDNGHAEPELIVDDTDRVPTRTTQRTGRHQRSSRSGFFSRRRSRQPEPHDHRYESSKTVGGITRSVCAVCGHVSFAGEDVYNSW